MATARNDNRHKIYNLLQARNPDALEYFFEIAPKIQYNLSRKFGARIPKQELEDIVRNTLIEGFVHGEQYNPTLSSVETWLHVKATYNALTFLKEQQHISAACLDSFSHMLAAQIERPNPLEEDTPSELMEIALKTLTPVREKVIRLYYYEGLTHEEIAEELSIGVGTVRVYLSRGRADLRGLIEDEGA